MRRFTLLAAVLAALCCISPTWAQDKKKKDKEAGPGIAHMKLSSGLSDNAPAPPNPLFGAAMGETLKGTIDRIKKAGTDAEVKALMIHFEGFSGNWTDVSSLRQALANFKKTGKKSVAFFESGSQGAYLIAAACDEVIVPPLGGVELPGLQYEMMFFKDAMEKFGLKGDVVPVGDFKAAGEPFSRSNMSEANRKQWDALADSIYDTLVTELSASRKGFTPEKVKQLVDKAMFSPKDAVAAGLVDRVEYHDETIANLKKALNEEALVVKKNYGKPKDEELDMSNPFAIFKLLSPPKDSKTSDKPKIALIYATGSIITGKSGMSILGGSSMGSTTIVELIKKAEDEPTVKAIVMRVDSGGGSALASDLIWNELKNSKKPVIVSMGAVAGSGGYYISIPARKIFAEPCTITGSIGVIGMKVVTGGAFKNFGINTDTVSRGKLAGMMTTERAFTEEEREALKKSMLSVYDEFLSKSLECRNKAGAKLDMEKLKSYAGGRIYTGKDAKKLGLIDEVGTLDDAIAEAKVIAGFKADEEVELFIQPKGGLSMLDSLMNMGVANQFRSLVQTVPNLKPMLQQLEIFITNPKEKIWLMAPYVVTQP